MFKVVAHSLQSYLRSAAARRGDLDKLNALIREAAPHLRRYFHPGTPAGEGGMRMKMIGYGKFRYANRSGKLILWPVIGVALQKHYISVYVSVTRGGIPMVRSYVGELGESRAGRNNFSFERFDQLQAENLHKLCREIAVVFENDPQNPVRYKQG